MEKSKIDFKRMARAIFPAERAAWAGIVKKHRAHYRHNCRNLSIDWAIMMAKKAGKGKAEREISWLALYLERDVFKLYSEGR